MEDMLFVELLSSHQVNYFIGLFIVLAFYPLYLIYSSVSIWNFDKLACLKLIILLYKIIVDELHFVKLCSDSLCKGTLQLNSLLFLWQ